MFKMQIIFLSILTIVLGKFSLAENLIPNTIEAVNNIVEFDEIDVQPKSVGSASIIFQSPENKSEMEVLRQIVIIDKLKYKLNDGIALIINIKHQTIGLKIQVEDILNKKFKINNFPDNQLFLFNPALQNFNFNLF